MVLRHPGCGADSSSKQFQFLIAKSDTHALNLVIKVSNDYYEVCKVERNTVIQMKMSDSHL